MSGSVLPTDDEVLALVPGVGSITWRRAADLRAFAGAGYALVLQVAHPTVGAGVSEHSSFKQDPWGRLWRTLDFTSALVYADAPEAAAVCRNIRAMHKRIKGVKADGTRYHALEPEAYAWVHATLFEAIDAAHGRFGSPLRPAERERLWFEWRRLGRLLGVRERDLPATAADFDDYFEAMVADVLEDTEAARDVLASLADPSTPPLPWYATPLWRAGRLPLAHGLQLATIGLMPSVLRERLGLSWSRAEELELRARGRRLPRRPAAAAALVARVRTELPALAQRAGTQARRGRRRRDGPGGLTRERHDRPACPRARPRRATDLRTPRATASSTPRSSSAPRPGYAT